jgi:hypothetical protein
LARQVDLHFSQLTRSLGFFGFAAVAQNIGLGHGLLEHQITGIELHQHLTRFHLVANFDQHLAQVPIERGGHEQQVFAAQGQGRIHSVGPRPCKKKQQHHQVFRSQTQSRCHLLQ